MVGWNALAGYFADPLRGIIWLMGVFLALTALYVWLHIQYPAELKKGCWFSATAPQPDGAAGKAVAGAPTGKAARCRDEQPAIYPSHADFLHVIVDKNRLLSFFSDKQITSIEAQINAYLQDQRAAALDQRAEVLSSVADTASELGALSGFSVPAVTLAQDATAPGSVTAPAYEFPLPPTVLRDLVANGSAKRSDTLNAALAQTNLDQVTHWLLYVAARYGVELPNGTAGENCTDSDCTGLCASMTPRDVGDKVQPAILPARPSPQDLKNRKVKADRLIYEIQGLSHLCRREHTIWTRALSLATHFGDEIGFGWLHLEGGWWIGELIYLAWVGVIANTLVAILSSLRKAHAGQGGYDPEMFLMILPKIVLAPIMAIVVAALVVSGFMEGGLSLANAKMFLVFGFISGFASERFTGIVRASISKLMPRLDVSDDKLEGPARPPSPPPSPPAKSPAQARTVSELRTVMRQAATSKAGAMMAAGAAASTGGPSSGQGGIS